MYGIFSVLASCLALSFGLESGWISPVTKYLQSDDSPTGEPLSDNDIAWVASAMTLTATIGVPMFAFIADIYGSKVAAILLTIPQAVSMLLLISINLCRVDVTKRHKSRGLVAFCCEQKRNEMKHI